MTDSAVEVEDVRAEDAELEVARWRAKGFEPHLVAMTGRERQTLSFVFQRTRPGIAPCVFAPPRPFRDSKGALFTASLASLGSCVAVAAAGAPTNPSGAGLVVATIHASNEAHRVPWAIHLHRVPHDEWRELDEIRLLQSIARLVVALPITGSDGEPYVLSLFRDERGDPPRAREITIVEHQKRSPVSSDDAHPIDAWMLAHMRESGARHAQIAVVRGDRLPFARAYTFAEAGYPVATMDHALRLGSVSKALVAIALLGAIAEGKVPRGLDASVVSLLELQGAGPRGLESVSVGDLLLHRSGLGAFPNMSPGDRDNPLSEARIVGVLGQHARARPGDLRAALAKMRDASLFDESARATAYSNEGFTLLGELLSKVVSGRYDQLDAVFDDMFRACGVDTEARGTLAAPTSEEGRARGESPADGSSPTFRRIGSLVPLAYATNLQFYGGAVGLSVPVLWVAHILRRLLSAPQRTMDALGPCLADLAAGARSTYGFYAGEPGWWKARSDAGLPETFRTLRLHHNGRIEGGSSLLMIQVPPEPRPGHLGIGVIAAMNQIGDLYEDPHGRELFGILRSLERSEEWVARDLFDAGASGQ